jgi:hypothetical protein
MSVLLASSLIEGDDDWLRRCYVLSEVLDRHVESLKTLVELGLGGFINAGADGCRELLLEQIVLLA